MLKRQTLKCTNAKCTGTQKLKRMLLEVRNFFLLLCPQVEELVDDFGLTPNQARKILSHLSSQTLQPLPIAAPEPAPAIDQDQEVRAILKV